MMLLAALVLAQSAPIPRPPVAEIDRVEAHLFYMGTGRLSDDLLDRAKEFTGWNTIIGEGDAEELADDVLVSVRLKGRDQEQIIAPGTVALTVTDAKGKVLGARKWNDVLTSKDGVVVLPVWLHDVGCAGDLNIRAVYGDTTKTGKLTLECGE